MSFRHAAIITAAGSSRRFNESANSTENSKKEFLSIDGMPILCRAVTPFLNTEGLCALVVTYRDGDLEQVSEMVGSLVIPEGVRVFFVQGGATRQASVFNALKFLHNHESELPIQYVSIHDGARPFVTQALVSACLEAAAMHGGACPCIRVTDTLVRVDEDGLLSGRLDRSGVCRVQTPQTFRFPDIYEAHCKAISGKVYTDDTEVFMDFGGKVAYVEGLSENRKITYAQDLKGATL